MIRRLILSALITAGVTATAADFPEAEISNGIIRAKLYLPDPERGYYRGSRFDWSGVIASLTYRGHNYFGKWFEHYDPRLHDAITGPVDEFRSEDGALGFAEAKPRGLFIKIGVGLLVKPDEKEYSFARPYQIASLGRRVVRPDSDRIEFVHELSNGEGYAYVYRKTVRLARNKPQLILEHWLKNTGRRTIETSVYNHDFFTIDNGRSGPDFLVHFAFPARSAQDLKGLAAIRGNDLVYLRPLEKGQSVSGDITGFSDNPADNNIRVENRESGAGVRETGDHPLWKLFFWSIPTTVCPEAYVHLKIDPGRQAHWRIIYEFYETRGQETRSPQ